MPPFFGVPLPPPQSSVRGLQRRWLLRARSPRRQRLSPRAGRAAAVGAVVAAAAGLAPLAAGDARSSGRGPSSVRACSSRRCCSRRPRGSPSPQPPPSHRGRRAASGQRYRARHAGLPLLVLLSAISCNPAPHGSPCSPMALERIRLRRPVSEVWSCGRYSIFPAVMSMKWGGGTSPPGPLSFAMGKGEGSDRRATGIARMPRRCRLSHALLHLRWRGAGGEVLIPRSPAPRGRRAPASSGFRRRARRWSRQSHWRGPPRRARRAARRFPCRRTGRRARESPG